MEVETLKRLALMGANREQVSLSSTIFATSLGMSPQTAARRLSSLEGDGYISRVVTPEGQKVKITDKGISLLRSEYMDYQRLFEKNGHAVLKGKVVTGLGEGQYYISLDGYRNQFNEKLGFDPYPGTLNIRLTEPFAPSEHEAVKIAGFKGENRTFGGCKCYLIKIKGVMGAIIRPDRSSYPPNLIEVIAPVNLRKTLRLADGDNIEVTLE